jgi:hypothetical protein
MTVFGFRPRSHRAIHNKHKRCCRLRGASALWRRLDGTGIRKERQSEIRLTLWEIPHAGP